mmetsp:Transcript_18752/g.37612  ORF Transcript_18752/g.37612 Transcript_18752/m.37612 type:complete len:128 (+) Transcript_18752:1672-2055(+)
MTIYQRAQQTYKNNITRKTTRQVQVVKPDATEEEIDAIMLSELLGTENGEINKAFSKAASKYQDILKLEQLMAELHQMFLDLALLTDSKGEQLDVIEYNVTIANEDVRVGNNEVVKSIEHQRKIRKK